MLFGCVRQNINDSSEKLKLIYIKKIFVLCNKDKRAEKYREVGGANSSSLKILLEWTGNVLNMHFCTIGEITLLVDGP